MKHFGVVVIGGGHAGTEAAHASARMGVSTALVTMKRSGIGVMSCNPAIGGLGKGHLVREIDAMDGVMGRVADASGIQFRLLNRRKGPAVQGPRTQSDRAVYQSTMLRITEEMPNLNVVEGEVIDFRMDGDDVSGVILRDGSEISASAVILTTGTFLRGVIHIGDSSYSGGRMGDEASVPLADRMDSFALPMGRLKTGTPPRLDGRTIRWDILDVQDADAEPSLFSFLSTFAPLRQIACGITHTNSETHDIIRENLGRSAMYGGHIEGVGPRYCPSIEDKIVRFADKDSHQVFLEPEGLNDHTIYPNGISTSLPADIQVEYVRSMVGLENAKILQPGYAIEYDYVDPRSLNADLAVRGIQGLYLAGQINGTTGYEEAAAQGLVAGINAAHSVVGREPVRFRRDESYIGVMIDDLTTRGVTEPYRMFTSRAEFRLSLRADNADQRLTELGRNLGCVSDARYAVFERKRAALDGLRTRLQEEQFTPKQIAEQGIRINQDGTKRTPFQVLAFPDVTFDHVKNLVPDLDNYASEIQEQVARDALYANYIARQRKDIEKLRKDEQLKIPAGFDYSAISGLSSELQSKLMTVQPSDLAQAGRIDGMTPAALALILGRIRYLEKRSA
ncbi:tRNA uridine-5-carboxymethylaminomethyl(34) synthesis enzyme MnmG [Tateyamaria omphalii]|uniref:tRNA uridine 5-carboxymethylaminomethyl modification enzyme MnmG n=1 Tax=Tateyamaria omphalii TaxID=299262 RepID=A0A1P8N126_9RHOB|nr:tRNA uridine-5-carboxymethylaminomethyl(34) synthesis enzyme MnmG [Tateyamaria omphalii]APX13952.1 tRNA uridine-5-carboxymethylaminomethyl(34) synthesis enzyme MnmG [Tateyamaria omphalii]